MTTQTTGAKVPAPPRLERLVSLDALRGFDILLLLCLGLAGALRGGPFAELCEKSAFWSGFFKQFEHVPWEGFALCDLAMPLFVFMSGATIPFSTSRYVNPDGTRRAGAFWLRVLRRFVALWILGMAVQGQLLGLEPQNFKWFSNTLQSIAVGYVGACAIYWFFPKRPIRAGLIAFFALLFAFWAGNKFIVFNGCGGGKYAESQNLPFAIDLALLGSHRDGVGFGEGGKVEFYDGYQYTWIFSSLTFVATAISGLLCGELLKRTRQIAKTTDDAKLRSKAVWRAFWLLTGFGVASAVVGYVWGKAPESFFAYCPCVKHIWTPTMVLLSSGYSIILLAAFYWLCDVIGKPGFAWFLTPFGTNALAAYLLSHLLHFDQIVGWLLYGTERFVGVWYGSLLQFAGIMLIWALLYTWKKGKIYLRV